MTRCGYRLANAKHCEAMLPGHRPAMRSGTGRISPMSAVSAIRSPSSGLDGMAAVRAGGRGSRGVELGGKSLAEQLRAAQEVALERVQGQVERVRGFRVVEAHHVTEHDRGAVLEWQLDDRGRKRPTQLGGLGRGDGVGAWARIGEAAEREAVAGPVGPVSVVSERRRVDRRLRAGALARGGAGGGSQCDRVQPGGERRARLEALHLPEGGDERLLHHVLGGLAVKKKAIGERVQAGSVEPHEDCVRGLGPLLASPDELLLVATPLVQACPPSARLAVCRGPGLADPVRQRPTS